MRGTFLAIMAVLALTTMSFGAGTAAPTMPTLTAVWDGIPAAGYRTVTVQATGVDIATLGWFTITGGDVYQVWNGTPTPVQSPWLGDPATCPGATMDSYVIYGNERLPMSPVAYPAGTIFTAEDIEAGQTSALGTLNNYSPEDTGFSYDVYLNVNQTMTGTEQTVDLIKLVIPQGQTLSLSCAMTVAYGEAPEYKDAYKLSERYEFTGATALSIYAPWDGDTDEDGDVDFDDFGHFSDGWFGATPSWLNGDFDGDSDVDFDDFGRFSDSWFNPNTPHGGTEGIGTVPEPGTFVMLALGALCLVGYRARRK